MRSFPVLAIDIGSSSVRSALFNESARTVNGTLTRRPVHLRTSRDGMAEVDPNELVREVRKCLRESGKMGSFRAVGVSCFWHSLMGTDEAGNPLTPIFTWADSRCRTDAAQLRADHPEYSVHSLTGCMLRASYWPAKLRWIRRTRPRVFRSVKLWMSPAEWIQGQITGAALCSHGMATGTGLYNPRTLRWSEEMLDMAGIAPHQLNPLGDAPFPWRGAEWYPAIGDGAAGNLGSGATRSGVAAINVGTSAAVRTMGIGTPGNVPLGLFCYRVDERRFVVGGAVSNAGNLHAWCQRELDLPRSTAKIESQLAARPTPDHQLMVLPYWNSERAPDWNEEARGTIHGITAATTALDLFQAITEGFYYRIAKIADLVADGRKIRFILSGGILQSPSATQRLANVLGRSITPSAEPEASLRGAAVFALQKLGIQPEPLPSPPSVRPQPTPTNHYREQRQLIEKFSRHLPQ